MKKIDWYIFRKYLGTFFFIILLLNSITVVIDISEKIDSFLEPNVTWREIVFNYYIYFIPYITAILAPFFALIACIFFTSQLADRSEIIAIVNSGTSFYRMIYPYLLGALVLAGLLYYGNNFFIPFANKNRIAFENKYINRWMNTASFTFHRQVQPGQFIYIENYRPADSMGYKFSIDNFKNGRLIYKLRSEQISWLPKEKKWRISNYYARAFDGEKQILSKGISLDTILPFSPSNFSISDNIKEEMTTPQLSDYINKMYKNGSSYIEFYEVEKHRRTASAFSIFIMTLIGVSVASRKVRGGLGWHLVLGIGICALYEIIMKFSVTFSTNSTLPPFIGVWIPNFIFGIVAIYMVIRAPK